MAETYYKLPGSILTDIADALRAKKNTTKGYAPEQFAGVIMSMVVKPVEFANSKATFSVFSAVSGASGAIINPVQGIASTAASFSHITAETSAVGILPE